MTAEQASPWADWDRLSARQMPALGWMLRAAGVGFVVVAGRYAEVDAIAAGLLVLQLGVLIAARRWPYPSVAFVVVLQLVLFARGNGPNIGIGAVLVGLAAIHKHAAARDVDAGVVPQTRFRFHMWGLGVMALLSFTPWLLDWSSGAVLSGPARDRNPWTTFLVLTMLHIVVVGGTELTSLLRSARLGTIEAEAARDKAVLDERARIARELHDVVAHQMSVVVTQAQGGAAVIDDDPAKARRAFDTISSTTREALVELRRLVGVTRPSDEAPDALDPTVPQPGLGLDDLGRLATTAELAGLQVAMSIELDSESPVPAGIALSAYRTIQEALTNAAKHAPGASVQVDLRQERHELRAEVTNGPPMRRAADAPGSGVGLIGMRERITLFGGTLEAGPAPGGGWSVVATFPTLVAPSTSE